jgi:hypothetical protein
MIAAGRYNATPERIDAAIEKMARDLGYADGPAPGSWQPTAGDRCRLVTAGGVYLVQVICEVDVYGVAGVDARIVEVVKQSDPVLHLDAGDIGTWPVAQLEAVSDE